MQPVLTSADSSPTPEIESACPWSAENGMQVTCKGCCAGLIFWYGGQLIKDREITLTELLKASSCSRLCEA